MSFSKTTNKVLWCILLLWSLMIARNLVSSDLKGDEEAVLRDGDVIKSEDVQNNTEGNFFSPVDFQRSGNVLSKKEGNVIESGNVQINANENSSSNILSATGTFREGDRIESGNVQRPPSGNG